MPNVITDDKTVTIGADGTVNVHRVHHDHFDGGSFFAGIMAAFFVMWLTRLRRRRNRDTAAAVTEAPRNGQRDFEREYHELAKRTATLERIVTDPAQRVHNEIEALR